MRLIGSNRMDFIVGDIYQVTVDNNWYDLYVGDKLLISHKFPEPSKYSVIVNDETMDVTEYFLEYFCVKI